MTKIAELLVKQAELLRESVAEPVNEETEIVKEAAINHLVESGIDFETATKLIEARLK